MKAEFSVLCQYAADLAEQCIITHEDYSRICNSLESKGYGFVADLCDLLDDFRHGLSTGYFALSERTNCVFQRSRKSKLPKFLGLLFLRVFALDGSIHENADGNAVATITSLLSLLKRIDPPNGSGRELSDKVWSTLQSNFADHHDAETNFLAHMDGDPEFNAIMLGAQERFQERCSRIPFEAHLVYGPGKNLDRKPSALAPDWTLHIDEASLPCVMDRHIDNIKRLYRKIRRLANHEPSISYTMYRNGKRTDGLRITQYNADMRCTAVPKSYKAYRGVGVMSSSRMMLQLSLQRSFYKHALDDNLPLADQSVMTDNLVKNFEFIGTIDLSSASDRMYWWLLQFLGGDNPFFRNCYALRTQRLLLPRGVQVECVSPVMGEAITFPLMSNAFVSIALSVCDYYGWGHDMVRVYGDDIQTPHYWTTLDVLKRIGSKPSIEKSYSPISRFKESCEAHYFGDLNSRLTYVRPVYVPSFRLNSRNRIHHSDAVKLLLLGRDAYDVDTVLSASCATIVERYTSLRLPSVSSRDPRLGRVGLQSEDSTVTLQTRTKHELPISHVGWIKAKLRSPLQAFSEIDKVSIKRSRQMLISQIRKIKVSDARKKLEHAIVMHYAYRLEREVFEKAIKQKTEESQLSCCLSLLDEEKFADFVREWCLSLSEHS